MMLKGKANLEEKPKDPPEWLAKYLSSQVISAVSGGTTVASLTGTRGLASVSQTIASSGYLLPQYVHFFMCDILAT
jgi:hypothetical protein